MRTMISKEKQLTHEEAIEILAGSQMGLLATADKDGQPYGTPINYIYSDNSIYFHCALEGHKLNNIAENTRVCFTVIGKSEVVAKSFTSHYESVIVFGKAVVVVGLKKLHVMRKFVEKYSPDYLAQGDKVIEMFIDKCHVVQIVISHVAGKKNG
ncbi:pyridoxamine 5'-phosphate oxidase family protein [Paenibacillus durus]|uniref:MFS transporter n=1 Tax=Paenibacillus durus TaxID=44251 RepID=A0A089HJH8_PAEDU|nr:pyridoxamine 5'-phosphate oxidase family protein [Paenibacillus durus]AIQ11247.1 hypothetical protein PDUR_03975 [Paenibacillus durus]